MSVSVDVTIRGALIKLGTHSTAKCVKIMFREREKRDRCERQVGLRILLAGLTSRLIHNGCQTMTKDYVNGLHDIFAK